MDARRKMTLIQVGDPTGGEKLDCVRKPDVACKKTVILKYYSSSADRKI